MRSAGRVVLGFSRLSATALPPFPALPRSAQQAQEEYRLQMALPDERLDVLLCTTLIARHRYPLLEHDSIVEQLDDLAVQVGPGGWEAVGCAAATRVRPLPLVPY